MGGGNLKQTNGEKSSMKIEDQTYLLKNNAPIIGVDDFNKIAQNLLKPGESSCIAQRQQSYSRMAEGYGYGDSKMNVLVACENPVSGGHALEQLCHDKLGPNRNRIPNENGGTTRELAKDVSLQDQILLVCLMAQGTVEEIDSDDARRFEPTSAGMRWAFRKIRQFDIAVVEEGFNWMPYGRQNRKDLSGGWGCPWEDGAWESARPNNSEKAHEVAIKFNPENMPVAFNFCKYEPKVFAGC